MTPKNCFADTQSLQTKPLVVKFTNSSYPNQTVTITIVGDTSTETLQITTDANGIGQATLNPTPVGWTFASLEFSPACTAYLVDFN